MSSWQGVVLGAMGLLANRCGRGLRRHSAAAGYERQMNKWLNMSSRCARYLVPPRRTDGVATRAAGPHALLGQRRQYTVLPARAQCQNCRMGAASIRHACCHFSMPGRCRFSINFHAEVRSKRLKSLSYCVIRHESLYERLAWRHVERVSPACGLMWHSFAP